ESFKGLVEQQYRRDQGHGTGNGDHLLLTTTQIQSLTLHESPHFRKQGKDTLLHVLAGSASPALRRRQPLADLQVLRHRQLGENRRALGRIAQAESSAL